MTTAFDFLVLATFFAPMALLVAVNLLAYRPLRGGDGLLDLPAPAARAPQPAAEAAPSEELYPELRRAA